MSANMFQVYVLISAFIMPVSSADSLSKEHQHLNEEQLNRGTQVYLDRCSICHGNAGMGEGLIAMLVDDYPSTNLMNPKYGIDHASLLEAVMWGGSKGGMNELSPPWVGELSQHEINDVVNFVIHLRANVNDGMKRLESVRLASAQPFKASIEDGQQVYKTRCVLCHGEAGKGDGKMRKVIKNPPPFDLTSSVVPEEYVRLIVSKGGEFVGRSPQMPPWKDELTSAEMDSVISYIIQLRE